MPAIYRRTPANNSKISAQDRGIRRESRDHSHKPIRLSEFGPVIAAFARCRPTCGDFTVPKAGARAASIRRRRAGHFPRTFRRNVLEQESTGTALEGVEYVPVEGERIRMGKRTTRAGAAGRG